MSCDVVVQVSGGIDSAAAAVLTVRQFTKQRVLGLYVSYGQAYHAQEARAAQYVADVLGISPLRFVAIRGLPLVAAQPGSPAEYAPVRNAVLGMVAASVAQSVGAHRVVVGNKSTTYRPDDPYSFRDCTAAFFAEMTRAVGEGSEPGAAVRFCMPMAGSTKRCALELCRGAGMDLMRLWWCYDGRGDKPCLNCRHCQDVAKAIEERAWT